MKNIKKDPGATPSDAPVSNQDENNSDNFQKTLTIVLLVISGFLLLILIIVIIGGVYWMGNYKESIDAKNQQDLKAMQNYVPADTPSVQKQQIQTGHQYSESKVKAERYPRSTDYLSVSTYYWNCKYRYDLNYPKDWIIDDQTHNALQVFIKGSGITVKLESIGLVSGETLWELANRRNEPGKMSPDTAGTEVWSGVIDWNGVQLIETHYTNPDAIVLHWLQGGRGMEVMIFGSGFNSNYSEIKKMLATLEIGLTNMIKCETKTPSSTKKSAPASTKSSFDCNSWIHPNGDVEYWWDQISPQEKDCYVTRYGAPSFYEP